MTQESRDTTETTNTSRAIPVGRFSDTGHDA
jgi:hypothetical protein